jgi:Uncharacterized conserved protein
MTAKTAYSTKEKHADNLKEIIAQLGVDSPTIVLFFASTKYSVEKVGQGLQKAYPNAKVVGASTAGEIVTGKMLKNSVVAMAFDKASIADVDVAVVENIKTEGNFKSAFTQFEKHYKQKLSELDIDKYVGLVLVDGLSGQEEKVMDKIGNLTDLTFIGGSAGDDLKFKSTEVYANKAVYSNAAVLALLKPTKGYDIIKTQSFKVLPKKLVADKVDEANRVVISFNKAPALEAYAKATKTTKETAQSAFMKNPVGLMLNGEPYVRSPQQVNGDSIVFYCNIKEGTELSLLESTDIVADTEAAMKQKISAKSKPAGVINFHCILRTLELEEKKQTEAYGKVFEKVPTVGFSTYGEQYLGHINQTSTILIIK